MILVSGGWRWHGKHEFPVEIDLRFKWCAQRAWCSILRG
jgi:hypothetical protein